MAPARKIKKRLQQPERAVESKVRRILFEIALLLCSSLLFALAFPNFLDSWGFFPLGFVCLAPIVPVIHRSGWVKIFLYGFLYGLASYVLFNYWLAKFHPLAIVIVPAIYSVYFLALFPVLKLADLLLPRYGYLLQTVIWVAYEYLKTLGFLGYPYGNIGYSQYLFTPFIQIASLTGEWGVSFMVALPSFFLGRLFQEGRAGASAFLRSHALDSALYGLLFAAVLVYGFLSPVSYASSRSWRVALIQQDVDPWRGGLRTYRSSLDILERESRLSLAKHPDIVVWSETSFVPAIDWHTRYRTDDESYRLVKDLRAFLSSQRVPYVVGNDDGERDPASTETLKRIDYNATLLFVNGALVQTYRKLHLVPFTEYFPYRAIFPGIYQMLANADTHFWKEGTRYTVFEADGVKFSTPICFEDVFGYLSRNFVRRGAQVIVNMTNDWWSQSVTAEMQHMSMSLFRAVENRRTMVRSTNGGMTCTIDPNGRITSMIKPFVEGYLVKSVPVYTGTTTLYTRYGDWFAVGMLALALALLSGFAAARIVRTATAASRRAG